MQFYFPVKNNWEKKNWDSMKNVKKSYDYLYFQKYGGLNILKNLSQLNFREWTYESIFYYVSIGWYKIKKYEKFLKLFKARNSGW